MRNIYVLPTDKPSRLIHNDANQLCYQSNKSFKNDRKWMYRKAFNICITSDEEIKEENLTKEFFVVDIQNGNIGKLTCKNRFFKGASKLIEIEWKNKQNIWNYNHIKKIILTTDQDLIKDGIQTIDDEFLEWFVKNPSYEEVKVDFTVKQLTKPCDVYNEDVSFYKIIIPKEDTLEEAAEKYANKFIDGRDGYYGFIEGAKWQQEQDNEVIQNLKDRLDTVRHINTTIIKAVEKLKEQYDIDVINAFNEGQALNVRGKLIQGKEWFEKFKNK